MPEKLVEVKDVEISFGEGSKKFVAVHNANFFINKGETFSLVGESGSGKTTIGRAIIGLNDTSNGDIIFDGKKINGHLSHSEKNDLIRRIQMIFQDPAASLNERATVDYILSEGLYNFHLYKDEEDRKAKIKEIIKEVGLLEEHLTRYPHEFSGGQRQRIGIARSLVMQPDLVIADEPISALDVSVRAQVLNLLKKFQKELGLTYLFITHDLSTVRRLMTCQWSVSFLTVSLLFTRGQLWKLQKRKNSTTILFTLTPSHSCLLFLFQIQSWNVRKS